MKFSIITPTYNRANLIERAIKSVLKQSYQNFEMIIVDDGSTDNTDEIVSKYLHDKRIRYVKATQNGGVNKARNIGLRNIDKDSDWITFLDSDDEFYPDALENIYFSIERKPEVKYFRFPISYVNGTTKCNFNLFNNLGDFELYLKFYHNYGDWVSVINEEIIHKGFLFDERVLAFESLTWLNLHKKEKIFYEHTFVLLCHVDNVSLTRSIIKNRSNYENEKKAVDFILNEYGNDFNKNNKKVFVSYLYEQAILNIILGNKKIGVIKALNAIKFDLFNFEVLRVIKNIITKKIK
jgi:glycosyltransferase involved in cell wall biosynthesis